MLLLLLLRLAGLNNLLYDLIHADLGDLVQALSLSEAEEELKMASVRCL